MLLAGRMEQANDMADYVCLAQAHPPRKRENRKLSMLFKLIIHHIKRILIFLLTQLTFLLQDTKIFSKIESLKI